MLFFFSLSQLFDIDMPNMMWGELRSRGCGVVTIIYDSMRLMKGARSKQSIDTTTEIHKPKEDQHISDVTQSARPFFILQMSNVAIVTRLQSHHRLSWVNLAFIRWLFPHARGRGMDLIWTPWTISSWNSRPQLVPLRLRGVTSSR